MVADKMNFWYLGQMTYFARRQARIEGLKPNPEMLNVSYSH